MTLMTDARLSLYDHVQLTEAVDDAPAGARGAVLEFVEPHHGDGRGADA